MRVIKFLKSRRHAIFAIVLLSILGILFFTDKLPDSEHPYDNTVEVIGISDGDSFTGLTKEKQQIQYRIFGIDAPEMTQPFGKEARDFLSGLLYGKTVNIVVIQAPDKYGREIVQVFTSDNRDVGAEMLKHGLAWHYRRFNSSLYYDLYEHLEFTAQANKRSIWSQSGAESPWKHRSNRQ